MKIDVSARRFAKQAGGATIPTVRASAIESVAMANVEPYNAELARAGRRFVGGTQIIANGIAPVQAIPTTTATVALYNGEVAGSGAVYYIDRIVFFLGSGTPAAGATLFVTVSPSAIASPPTAMATGWGVQSASGSSRRSKALWGTAVTVPSVPAAPAWWSPAATLQAAAANVGQGDNPVELAGSLAVPPGFALGIGILSGAGTSPLYGVSVSWAEIENSGELE